MLRLTLIHGFRRFRGLH